MIMQRRMKNEKELCILEDGTEIASISVDLDGKAAAVALAGSLKSGVAHDLMDELLPLVQRGIEMRVGFKEVSYISTACMDVFLNLQRLMDGYALKSGGLEMRQRKKGGTLTLCGIPADIAEELESTGITELLMIEE